MKTQRRSLKNEESAFYASVAKRLRAARKDAGLTQGQVALAVGLTRGAVTGWEKGGGKFSIPALRRVAALLGTSLSYLLWGYDEASHC